MKEVVTQSTEGMNVIFVHSKLDDLGLTPDEFRVYCHLARRSGKGPARSSVDSMAKVCKMSDKMVRRALKRLIDLNMIMYRINPGFPTHYHLSEPSVWINPAKSPADYFETSDMTPVDSSTPAENDPCLNLHPTRVDSSTPPLEEFPPEGNTPRKSKEGNTSCRSKQRPHPDHSRFVREWTNRYERRLRRSYRFQGGKDGTAVSELLKINGETCDSLLDLAEKAWGKIGERFSAGQHAQTIAGFNSAYQRIKNEFDPPNKNHSPDFDSWHRA